MLNTNEQEINEYLARYVDEREWAEAKQRLLALIEKEKVGARKDQIGKDLSGIQYILPVRSVRTSNTAMKKYAVKFFNGEIAKRRNHQLAQLKGEQHA